MLTGTSQSDIERIDHPVLYTTQLPLVAATYEALGFTLTPLSMHVGTAVPDGPRGRMGAGNRCAVFGRNYLELLGVFGDGSSDPWNIQPLVAKREGMHGCSFGCSDPAAVERRLRETGLSSSGVLPLQREVAFEYSTGTARFQAIHLEREQTPEGLVHIAHHLTPELIHQPRYLEHANGATGLQSVTLVVADDELDETVARYERTLATPARDLGRTRVLQLAVGAFEIVAASRFSEVLPAEPTPELPMFAAVTVTVRELHAARELIEGNGFLIDELGDGFVVGSAQAHGAAIVFREG